MKFSKRATSIAEAIVVMTVVVLGIVGMYDIYNQSTRFSDSVEHRVKAIWIAREWIEWITNMRDTNWILFSTDYKNCWNTLNYQVSCIDNTTNSTDIVAGTYIIYQDTDNRWKLQTRPTYVNYLNTTTRNNYKVGYDTNWNYAQSTRISTNTQPLFTRRVVVSYDWWNSDKMLVDVIVEWMDSSSEWVKQVTLNTRLNNWKNKKF